MIMYEIFLSLVDVEPQLKNVDSGFKRYVEESCILCAHFSLVNHHDNVLQSESSRDPIVI